MPLRKTRHVSLTPEMEAFIDGRVASGRYRSASEVVRAALRLLGYLRGPDVTPLRGEPEQQAQDDELAAQRAG